MSRSHRPDGGDRHREALELLPWFVTGALDDGDRRRVREHLDDCPSCRAEVEVEKRLSSAVAAPRPLPAIDAAASLESVRRRIGAPLAAASIPARPRRPGPVERLRRAAASLADAPPAWRLAALVPTAAAILLAALLARTSLDAPAPVRTPATYRVLAAPQEAGAPLRLWVQFAPDARESELRDLLRSVDAEIVGGPRQRGVYELAIDLAGPADPDALLHRLAASPLLVSVVPRPEIREPVPPSP